MAFSAGSAAHSGDSCGNPVAIAGWQAARLLMSAQATEILARHPRCHNLELSNRLIWRARLQATKDMMDADLRYPWSIATAPGRASRRSFNLRFRAAYGVSAIDYPGRGARGRARGAGLSEHDRDRGGGSCRLHKPGQFRDRLPQALRLGAESSPQPGVFLNLFRIAASRLARCVINAALAG